LNDELVARARTGDEQALRLLYEGQRRRVLRLASALLGDNDEAEDVMQDVLVYALTHLENYDPRRAKFSTWLHVLTVNRCRDRLRRRSTGWRRMADWLRTGPGVTVPGPEDRAERLDAARRVEAGLRRLTPLQREALVLRDVEELSFSEMAQVLDVPLRTAQARVVSAHAAMRRALGEGTSSAVGDGDR